MSLAYGFVSEAYGDQGEAWAQTRRPWQSMYSDARACPRERVCERPREDPDRLRSELARLRVEFGDAAVRGAAGSSCSAGAGVSHEDVVWILLLSFALLMLLAGVRIPISAVLVA